MPSGPAREPRITLARAVLALAAVLLVAAAAVAVGGGAGGDDADPAAEADAQTVSFQQPEDPGPDPFTDPADVEGDDTVEVSAPAGGEQPFGGSGSNRVCDRDKLIRFLREHPDRMREWARVLGVDPTYRAVRRYIAKLHPVTLTRDTQVTNHAFRNGRALPFQAILQAGTAVLVDEYGTPVARCYCGNPLKPAVFTPTAKCSGCPPDYEPPRQCRFRRRDDHDEVYYRREHYSNASYDEVFIRRQRRSPYRDCYEAYPDPPTVTIVTVYKRPAPEPEPEPAARPPVEQRHEQQAPDELQCDPPRSQLEFEQCAEREGRMPEHVPEQPRHEQPAPAGGLQCDPPRSQLEFEQCTQGQAPAPHEETQPMPEEHSMPEGHSMP